MKKKILSLTLALSMVFGLTACGGSKTEAPAEKPAEGVEAPAESGFDTEYTWSFSTTYASAAVVVQMYQKFAELANEYTDGKVTINVYPDGTVASEDDALAQVSSGELEFCGTGTAPVYTYSNENQWLIAPFLITDKETYYNVYNSDYWQNIRASWASEHNVLDLCGPFYRGMRTLVSTEEVRSAADLKGLKLRMNSNAMWNAAWQALGCTTVTIPLGELYTSIQTGVVASCENPISESGNLNIPEVAKYVVPTNHVVECAGIFMSNSLFTSLPQNYQDAIRKAGEDAMTECVPLIEKEEADWTETYRNAGAEVVKDLDLDSIKAASQEFWKSKFASDWTGISYDDAMALIAECSK
ncbi:TRAP transporter substrate-binding protein [Oscillibacter sp.]|uniref:TRAP transporter substrate-binding protein n=1 Tax=Oscillibacter sp. TaxID=1945593 RepID=UPI0026242E03|nr:TRAP transporter substrate-binding protein [Oscillibacter sp.]MDD3347896.1 TRAP transporter substrate-binding protein [Oscillibacter sp.]